MAHGKAFAVGLPAAQKNTASARVKPETKSTLETKVKPWRPPAVKAAAVAERSNAVAKPETKRAVSAVEKRKPATARGKGKAAALSYMAVFRASPLERIDMIRRGVPASEAKRIFADLRIGQGVGLKALNLRTATINKKAKQGETLSPEESERIVGFAKLVGQLEAMIQDSGDPTNFDPQAWMARWLTEPLPAFGGERPADLLDTIEGQGLVSAVLAKIQSGAYA